MLLTHKEVVLRLVLALVIGGFIGFERGYRNRPAGFRTYIVVCMGAAIVSLVQISMVNQIVTLVENSENIGGSLRTDIGRLGSQVISGIGFLGAGTIIKEKGTVKGLTTAASLWTVACIGLAIGMGYYFISIVSGVLLISILFCLEFIESRFIERHRLIKTKIFYSDRVEFIRSIEDFFSNKGIVVKDIEFLEEESIKSCIYTLRPPGGYKETKLINDLAKNNEILKIEVIDNKDEKIKY